MISFIKPKLPKLNNIIDEVHNMLDSGMITNDKYVRALENKIKEICNTKYAIATANCTSAFLMILKCIPFEKLTLGIPAFEWISMKKTVEIFKDKFKINYMDINKNTFAIDRTDYDITVALNPFGNKCNIKSKKIIIHDSAHCIGTEGVGGRGFAEIFSLSPSKLITACEGGIITTNDELLAMNLMEMRRWFSRMPEFNAVVGLYNLKYLDKILERKKEIFYNYKDNLPFKFQKITKSNYNLTSCLIKNRDEIRAHLKRNNIGTQVRYNPYNTDWYINLKNTKYVWENMLILPSHYFVDEKKVIKCIKEFW